jgi:hypothetical protein
MQLGFNTNFRHREVVFHVQTEDSGRANPHVITHLFHGGNIIASVKSDYTDLLSEGDLEGAVRKLMENQHKSMLKQLSRGEFDRAIRERLGAAIFSDGSGAAAEGNGRDTTDADASASERSGAGRGRPPTASEAGSSATDRTPGIARRPPPPSAGGESPPSPVEARPAAERTAVIPERRETTSGLARVFGERIVSEKPLDEVVLDYLVENARKRKRQPKP